MTLGKKIKAARLERGLTQKEVVGNYITRNMLSKIENDSATPSVRTLQYLASALDLPTGYFLSGVNPSDVLVPDGLNDARAAYREQRWLDCLSLLESDKTAGASDEGYLLHARAGAHAAKQAFEEGRLTEAKELADSAHYYNQEGLYYSPDLAAQLALLLGKILTQLGTQYYQGQHEDVTNMLETLTKIFEMPSEDEPLS